MKKLMFVVLAVLGASSVRADWYDSDSSRPQKDVWGNSYKMESNLDKDSDGDGVTNRYDYNDRNPNIQQKGEVDFSQPKRYFKDYKPKF